MLTPSQLEHYPDALVELYAQAEADIIADMAQRIAGYNYFIPSAQYQLNKLVEMGNTQKNIVVRLSELLNISKSRLISLMGKAGMDTLAVDDTIYRSAGLKPQPVTQSPALLEVLAAGINKTEGLFINLTGTTAKTATRQFERALDRAYMQISTGAFDYDSAIHNAVKDLSAKGLAVITYPSGHTDYLDVAVRRATLTGVNQTALKLQEARAEEMNCDLVEVSAHAGARTDGSQGPADHAYWQGKIYSRSGTHDKFPSLFNATGYGTGEGLGGWNCRHSMYPFFEGVDKPRYTAREIANLNAKKYEYNGIRMTEYEATQKQRYIERQIRKWKREGQAMRAAGLPTEDALSKLADWQRKQRDFLGQTGLKRQYAREAVGRAFAKSHRSDIINSYGSKPLFFAQDKTISLTTLSKLKLANTKLTTDFPEVGAFIQSVEFKEVDGLSENCFDCLTGKNIINLDKQAFANEGALKDILKSHFKEGFSYDTDSIESLYAHEFGHAVHNALALKRAGLPFGKPLTREQVNIFKHERNKITQDIYLAAFTDETYNEIMLSINKSLGSRANDAPTELIAQSFGNYYFGKQRTAIAEKIVNYLKGGF